MKFNPLNPDAKDKSIRRHMLKRIDRKFSAAQKALNHKKKDNHISKAFKTYGDKGKEHVGSFESRLDKYSKYKNK